MHEHKLRSCPCTVHLKKKVKNKQMFKPFLRYIKKKVTKIYLKESVATLIPLETLGKNTRVTPGRKPIGK